MRRASNTARCHSISIPCTWTSGGLITPGAPSIATLGCYRSTALTGCVCNIGPLSRQGFSESPESSFRSTQSQPQSLWPSKSAHSQSHSKFSHITKTSKTVAIRTTAGVASTTGGAAFLVRALAYTASTPTKVHISALFHWEWTIATCIILFKALQYVNSRHQLLCQLMRIYSSSVLPNCPRSHTALHHEAR